MRVQYGRKVLSMLESGERWPSHELGGARGRDVLTPGQRLTAWRQWDWDGQLPHRRQPRGRTTYPDGDAPGAPSRSPPSRSPPSAITQGSRSSALLRLWSPCARPRDGGRGRAVLDGRRSQSSGHPQLRYEARRMTACSSHTISESYYVSDSNYIMHKRKIYESGSRRHDVQRNRIKLQFSGGRRAARPAAHAPPQRDEVGLVVAGRARSLDRSRLPAVGDASVDEV